MEDKIDKIMEDITEIKVDLKYHIKRTNLLEDEVSNRLKRMLNLLRIMSSLCENLDLYFILLLKYWQPQQQCWAD